MNKIVKEVFIILLLCMIVIFTIGLLFYDCIPRKNEKIESIEYVADKRVTETIKEIDENSNSDITNTEENSLLKSYSIKKEDLKEFVAENYYETGKKDPFAEYSEPVEDEVVKTVTTTVTAPNVQAENKEEEPSKEPTNTITDNTLATNTVTSNTVVSNTTNKTVENKAPENKIEYKEEVKSSSEGKYTEKKNSK